MTKEKKLHKFILGLGDKLVVEIDALKPICVVDASIQAKTKLNNKTKEGSMG